VGKDPFNTASVYCVKLLWDGVLVSTDLGFLALMADTPHLACLEKGPRELVERVCPIPAIFTV